MDINMSINEILQNKQHVWVLFEDEAEKLEMMDKALKRSSAKMKKPVGK